MSASDYAEFEQIIDRIGALAQNPDVGPFLRNLYASLEDIRSRLTGED